MSDVFSTYTPPPPNMSNILPPVPPPPIISMSSPRLILVTGPPPAPACDLAQAFTPPYAGSASNSLLRSNQNQNEINRSALTNKKTKVTAAELLSRVKDLARKKSERETLKSNASEMQSKIASTSTDQEEAVNLERNLQGSNENVVKCKKDVSKSMAKISRKEGVIDVPLTSSTVPTSTDPASIDLTSSVIKSRLINIPNPLLYSPTPEERIIYIASAEVRAASKRKNNNSSCGPLTKRQLFNLKIKKLNSETLIDVEPNYDKMIKIDLSAEEDSIDEIEIIEVNSCNPKEEPNYEIPVIEISDDDDGTALENVNEEISDINLNLEIRNILDSKSLKPAVSSNPVKV